MEMGRLINECTYDVKYLENYNKKGKKKYNKRELYFGPYLLNENSNFSMTIDEMLLNMRG